MLGKRLWPGARKLAGPLRSGPMDSATRPRSPLECRMGLKNYDQGGIGLAIAVALHNSTNIISSAACRRGAQCSSPIPVATSARAKPKDMDLDEEFTYVTCHGPNRSTTTKVYYDGDVACNHVGFHAGSLRVFKVSPMVLSDDRCHSKYDSDFLSSCHLCKKNLHGKDIYMYRGEKAFCSTECRQSQITIDERKEKCRSELSRSNDIVSSSPCSRDHIFSTGILAI